MASLESLIASEDALVHEAALALPHSFDKCTYDLGPIRQAVYLCLTCRIPRGLCSACSVACHGDHEQIELFPKRAFTCDCPGAINGVKCTLFKGTLPVAFTNNIYGQNFHAKFCRCQRAYDAKKEKETMVQCVACEDWFHESCLNLRTRPNERPPTPFPGSNNPPRPTQEAENEDAESTASNDLPLALLPSGSYDAFICGACVLSSETLRKWAGTNGVMMVYREEGEPAPELGSIEEGGRDPRWKVFDGDDEEDIDVVNDDSGKRLRNDVATDIDDRPVKKLKASDGSSLSLETTTVPCLAPRPNAKAQRILNQLTSSSEAFTHAEGQFHGEGDIFLSEGWRDRWCRCPQCLLALERQKYLTEEEETYEPPEDPDSGKSLVDLGMRALLNLPRDRAIDGIVAYNNMRDELISYLRPFAQEGRVVKEEDVREFFEAKAAETGS